MHGYGWMGIPHEGRPSMESPSTAGMMTPEPLHPSEEEDNDDQLVVGLRQQEQQQQEIMPNFIEVHNLSEDSVPPEDHLDSVLSDALSNLTINEREKVYHDIHGVASYDIQETSQFLENSLEQMEQQLQQLKYSPRLPTQAFRIAESTNPTYVQNKCLRISFLRTDHFDTMKAAERFIKYFDHKLDLFGPELLCKPHITYNDLGKDTTYLNKGSIQVLPGKNTGIL